MKGICRDCLKTEPDYNDLAVIFTNTAEDPFLDGVYEDLDQRADERGITLPDEAVEIGICSTCAAEFGFDGDEGEFYR